MDAFKSTSKPLSIFKFSGRLHATAFRSQHWILIGRDLPLDALPAMILCAMIRFFLMIHSVRPKLGHTIAPATALLTNSATAKTAATFIMARTGMAERATIAQMLALRGEPIQTARESISATTPNRNPRPG